MLCHGSSWQAWTVSHNRSWCSPQLTQSISRGCVRQQGNGRICFLSPYAQFAPSNGLDVNLGVQPISEGFGFEGIK